MRRHRLLLVGCALLAAAGAFWAWPDADEPIERETAQVSVDPSDVPPAPRVAAFGRVSGVVRWGGGPVDRARVTLRAAEAQSTVTMSDGRFVFTDVPPGPVFLSATRDALASEVLGPIAVARGSSVDDLILTLRETVRVDVRTVDLLSREGVAGAQVTAAGQTCRADAAGRCALRAAAGPQWLEVSAPGYLPRSEWLALDARSAGGALELLLTPACRVRGHVRERGGSVAGAVVWAETLEGTAGGTRSGSSMTDAEGRFALEAPHGLLRLSATTPLGTRINGPVLRLRIGELRDDIELSAESSTPAVGVVSREGQPLPAAHVTALDALSEAVAAVAVTGPDGRFIFPSLVDGRYVVQVRWQALVAMGGPFEHRGDGQTWSVVLPAGATLAGRVEPPSAGVRVRWRSGAWPGPPAETVTDEAGRFTFEGLPREVVALEAEGPGGAANTTARPGDDVVLRLSRGRLVVHLEDERGMAVTDGVLLARSVGTGALRRQPVLAPTGQTTLELPEGRWELTLEVAGRGRSGTATVDVGATALDVHLSLEAGVAVRGTVRDSANGLPLAGVEVEAISGPAFTPYRVSVLTDAHGAYALPPTSRSARLTARHPAYRPEEGAAANGDRWDVALTRDAHQLPQPAAQFEGVGMVLDGRSGPITVAAVTEGGPAERAGVRPGDVVTAVDGVPTAGMPLDQVIGRIRGPAGTPVLLELERGGQRLPLTVRRRLLNL